MQVKVPTTYSEQLEILSNRGCIIGDRLSCENHLKNIGYYRLSAYFLPFKDNHGNYIEGTSFEKIVNIYEFDRELRNLIFEELEIVEINLRSSLSYFHANKYGSLGYLSDSSFGLKHNSQKFIENIKREIENNQSFSFRFPTRLEVSAL